MSLASGTGLVSGINFNEIISKLRQANARPIQQAQSAQSRISAQSQSLDGIKKVLLDFKSKAEALSKSENFLSMSASTSDYGTLTASTTAELASTGEYSIMVRQLAQAHRIASQGVATSDSTPVANGAGTFQFKVGNGSTVSIDVTAGMTLQQLRDKINGTSGVKVRASIISDGTATKPYRLVLTATESGQDNAISILHNDTTLNLASGSIEDPVAASTNAYNGTVAASGSFSGTSGRNVVVQITSGGSIGAAKYKVSLDGGVTWSANDAFTTSAGDVDVTGAAAEGINIKFTANASPVDFAVGDRFTIDAFVPQLQKAQNAIIEVDGVQVSRSSNTFTNAIEGVTLTAKKVSADPQRLKVENSTSGVVNKIKEFVTAYNTLVDAVSKETAFDKERKAGAALFGDSGVTGILSSLRQSLLKPVSANSTYTTLSSIGVTIDGTGHLSADQSKITTALNGKLDEVRRLFIEVGSSPNSAVQLSKSSDKTKTGSYSVEVTTAARQAAVAGGRALEAEGLTADETLTIAYNEKAVSVTLAAGQKLSQIVDTLNMQFVEKALGVQASIEDGKLRIASTDYGAANTVSVFSTKGAAEAGQLGIGNTVISDTGVDVAGKIGGVAATGSGQILKGLAGSDIEGLELKITSAAPLATTFTLTHGTAMEALQRATGLTDENGLFTTRKTSYEARLKEYDKRIESLSNRLDAEEERMKKQFNALETKLAALQSQGNSLLSQLSSLVGR